jgi:glutathione S-transferase
VPGFTDVAVFNMIRDDAVVRTPVDLTPYPNLKALFEAVGSRPEVKEWISAAEASMLQA